MEEQDQLPGIHEHEEPTWGQIVSELKVKTQLRGALAASLVEASPELRKIILVWPMIPLSRNENVSKEPNIRKGATPEAILFRKAWNGISIDYAKIHEYCGVKKAEAKPLVEQAKSLGMVYPDGEVNSTLLAYLTQQLGPELVEAITAPLS